MRASPEKKQNMHTHSPTQKPENLQIHKALETSTATVLCHRYQFGLCDKIKNDHYIVRSSAAPMLGLSSASELYKNPVILCW
jgi:hypothetical protein